MSAQTPIVKSRAWREYLARKMDWLLEQMDKEHRNCSTHSQRNAYQAIIRHEMELIRYELLYTNDPGESDQAYEK